MVLEGIALAATLLSVAVSIFKYYDEAARDRKKAALIKAGDVAKHFLEISHTIAEAADIIERGGRPSGTCGSLDQFSKTLYNDLLMSGIVSNDKKSRIESGGVMSDQEAREYARLLHDASNLEHSVDHVSSAKERQEMVDVLRTASGTFQAIGYGIFARR